jgi:chromate transporter
MAHPRGKPGLRELASVSLKIGLTSFGGPLVAMGLIHREAVEKRRWVSPEWFAETLGLLEAVPGPSASEMSISVGIAMRGRLGGLVAGLCYVLPGFFIMLALSALYFRYGAVPAAAGLLAGLKPAAMAVLTMVCLRLGRVMAKDRADALFMGAAFAACLLGTVAAWAILGLGFISLAWRRGLAAGLAAAAAALALLGVPPEGLGRLPELFLGTLKAGAMVTGGGFVIASFLQQDFVAARGWLSTEEFLAGLALAQFKPGPVVLLTAFVGYKVAGVPGAALAALGAFLPCFGILLAVGPHIERLRGGPNAAAFLRGMGAAAIGTIGAVAVELMTAAVRDVPSAALYAAGVAALWRLDPVWVLAGSALIGLVLL